MLLRRIRPLLLLISLGGILPTSCSYQEEIDRSLFQGQALWFDAGPTGLEPRPGPLAWTPIRWTFWPQAPRMAALITLDNKVYAAANRVGVIEIRQGGDNLESRLVETSLPLKDYTLDSLFTHDDKVIVQLHQEPWGAPDWKPSLPPAGLVWFHPSQNRGAVLPLPSQVRDPSRQLVFAGPTPEGPWILTWKKRTSRTSYETTLYTPATGQEASQDQVLFEVPASAPEALPDFWKPWIAALKETKPRIRELRLSEPPYRVRFVAGGTGEAWAVRGREYAAVLTEEGTVIFAPIQGGALHSAKLPDLPGRALYSGLGLLPQGLVASWEAQAGPFSGPSGLVYTPLKFLSR